MEKFEILLPAPWFSLEERSMVLEKLYSKNFEDVCEAVQRLKIWIIRMEPDVNIGIFLTYKLAHIMCLYEKRFENPDYDDDHFQDMYSHAISKFVTFATKCGQDTEYLVPIHKMARKIGIPDWIVELRHSAIHARDPSLEVLQVAAKKVMKWLKENYWDSETKHISNFHITAKVESKPKSVSYESVAVALKEIHQVFQRITGHRKIKDYARKKSDVVNRLMVLLEKHKGREYDVFGPLLWDELMFSAELESLIGKKGLDKRMKILLQIIKRLPTDKCIIPILKQLFITSSIEDSIHRKLAIKWIAFILGWIRGKKNYKTTYKVNKAFCRFIVNAASRSTVQFVGPALDIFGNYLTPEKVKTLVELAAEIAASPVMARYYLFEELGRNMPEYHVLEPEQSSTEEEESEEALWSQCPIGVIPSQLGMEMLNLKLPKGVNEAALNHLKAQKRPFDGLISDDEEKQREAKYARLTLL